MKPTQPEPDPIADMVEAAIAPYRKLLPAADLEVMREELWYLLEEHPVMQRMAAKVRTRPAPEASGEVAREGAPGEAPKVRRTGGDKS